MRSSADRAMAAWVAGCTVLAACGASRTASSAQHPAPPPITVAVPASPSVTVDVAPIAIDVAPIPVDPVASSVDVAPSAPSVPPSTTDVAEPSEPKVDVPVRSAQFDAGARVDASFVPAPVRLQIERIGVDAAIVPVGVAANDELEVPGGTEVGWYAFGPRPGARAGSAVLAAHVDYNGRPGAFFKLRKLDPGDRLQVVFDDRSVRRFEIVALEQYAKHTLPSDRVFARSGESLLTLITCGGNFDSAARSYDDNVVVYAVPLESDGSGVS